MKPRLLLVLFALASGAAHASSSELAQQFNTAWHQYITLAQGHEHDRIIAAAEKLVEIGGQALPADDERLPLLQVNLGNAQLAGGRVADARETLERALADAEALHGDNSPKLVPVLAALGDAQAEPDKPGAQMARYRRALKLVEKQHGDDSLAYADLALRAGSSVLLLSRSTHGRKLLVEAHEIYRERLGPGDRRTGRAAFYRGRAENMRRRPKQAAEAFEEALVGLAGDDATSRRYALTTRGYLVQAYESMGRSDDATPHCVAIGAANPAVPDADYLPVYRRAPAYPREALSRGQQGWVDFEFTVDEQGFVRDPVVVEREGSHRFEDAALEAVQAFRYAPRFVDGEAVAVDGVTTRITFSIQ